jgi:hypothetical protein
MIAEVRAVPLPIAVETHAPLSAAWEPEHVPVVAAVGEVRHDHDIVARPAIGPTMKGEKLVGVVDMVDVELLPLRPRV